MLIDENVGKPVYQNVKSFLVLLQQEIVEVAVVSDNCKSFKHCGVTEIHYFDLGLPYIKIRF